MSLQRHLLLSAACGFGVLAAGSPAGAQTIGEGQTVKISALRSSAAPTFQGGTLEVDNSGTYPNNFFLGAATSAQPANMLDAHGNAGVFSGVIADSIVGVSGNITILDSVGGGQTTFTGASTYTGPTTINSGATLALSGAGSIAYSSSITDNGVFDISNTTSNPQIVTLAGSGSVVLGNQTLIITSGGGGNDIFTGTISGAGSLSITGGVQILDGPSTYTGGTTITSGGALQIGNDDTAGSLVGSIANAGNLTFDRTDAISFANTISGAGSVNMDYGTVTFTTAEPYTGATTINTGSTLALSGSGSITSSASLTDDGTFDISATSGAAITALSGSGNLVLGAQTLTITTANDGIFTGVISGTGGLVLSGGSQILSGDNTYTGGTTVASGTLQIGGGATTGSVIGNIANSGTVAFDYANGQTFTGVISGTGAVSLINGTLTIATPQPYSGLTTITAGTLALSGSGTISASAGVVANGTFDISATGGAGATIASLSGTGIVQLGAQTLTIANAAGTFSGLIEGSGGLTLTGGTEVLSGTSTYTGVTTISGGTLALTALNGLTSPIIDNAVLDISGATNNLGNLVTVNIASLSGSGAVTLASNTLVLTNAVDTFSGVISGTGGLTISAGTETLTGANTYTGATTIASGGTLVLGNGGSLAPGSAIADSGTLDVSAVPQGMTFASLSGSGLVVLGANSLTLANGAGDFSGTISGTGGLVVSGGSQILSGPNTYTGGTAILSGATLQLGDGQTAGSIVGDVADAGTLGFDYPGTATFTGAISGVGAVNQLGGTTILTASNSYSGGTTITAGTLQIGDGTTAGSISGDVTDDGTLAFDHSDTLTFAGTISGSGGVSQLGAGILVLSAVNSYTGTTAIASGSTLALGAFNSIASSSDIVDNGILDVSATATPQISSLGGSGTVTLGSQTLAITSGIDTFSGVVAGTGGLVLSGGTQVFAGTNTYSGPTQINGGTLVVTGAIASSSNVTVNSGGTLSGTGTVPGTSVASGGTIAPGVQGHGTLSVDGPLSFASGSDFLVNTSSTSSPSLAVSGPASLAGTISVASTDGTYPLGQNITVLTAAGGVSGSFTAAAVPTTAGAQFGSKVSQDANDVYLTINLEKLSPLLPTGASLNPSHAVAGIDAAIANGDSLPAAFENLGNVSSTSLASDAQQFAGELGADIPQVSNTLFTPFQNAVFDHLADIGQLTRNLRPLSRQSGSDAWVAMLAGDNLVAADTTGDGSQKFSSSGVGFAGGGDWHLNRNFLLGVALSLGSTHFHVADDLGGGKAEAYQFGLYGLIHFTPRLYGAFLVAAGEDSITTARAVDAVENDALSASTTSQIYDGRYETGVNLTWIKPYLALEDRLIEAPAYSETGPADSSNYALSYSAHSVNTPDVEVGFRNATDVPMSPNWVLRLSDRFGFEHAAYSSFEAEAAYTALAGSGFTTFGAQPGKNSALVSLGAEFESRFGVSAGLQFESAVSSRSQNYDGILSIGYGW